LNSSPLCCRIWQRWLATLDGEQFAMSAHVHEYERFATMSPLWQLDDLRETVGVYLNSRRTGPYLPFPLAAPRCRARGIPSDGRTIRRLLSAAMLDSLTEQRLSYEFSTIASLLAAAHENRILPK
jgi:hypothetical protein